jgi:hypothetical protein
MRVGMERIELQGTLIRVDCPREISDLAKNISQVSIGVGITGIEGNGFFISGYRIRRTPGFLRYHTEIEPVDRQRRLSFNCRMEVTEGVSKPIQTVGDQAQEMAGLGIMRSQFERVSVGVFRLGKSTGLLMSPPLIEPGPDRLVSCLS